jgi:hypothetical protein
MCPKVQDHWLNSYANNQHFWKPSPSQNGHTSFARPLGLVETSFDTDGTYFGGRADMTAILKLEIRHVLDKAAFRKRIASAWTLLRLQHVLLMSRVQDDSDGKRCFVIDVPKTAEAATRNVEESITWLEDLGFGEGIEDDDLYYHAINVGRIIQPTKCLSKIHVLPLRRQQNGSTYGLSILIVMAHQISDGLSAYNWFNHFIRILNTPLPLILEEIKTSIQVEQMRARLPSAQEDLYTKVAGNKARQRWFWAIMRVLRHVQKTMPPTFTNPLRREKRLEKAMTLPQTYASVFDYSEASHPPMSSGHIVASLSPTASARLISLCREANLSIGAGCFALVGLSMMAMHASKSPSTTFQSAFGASFPLNPRAFFSTPVEADSCMLAFSEGILMPFVPSSLPIEKRFILVAKHANTGLRVYQKRLKDGSQILGSFDKYSSQRLLATGYLAQIERVDAKLPEEKRSGVSAQGQLKPRIAQYGATCGVSSVGSLKAYFRPGEHDINDIQGKDFVADYRGLKMGVRARENEFLIGSSTDANGIVGFSVSYDMNAISQEAAQKWAETISGLLERGEGPQL